MIRKSKTSITVTAFAAAIGKTPQHVGQVIAGGFIKRMDKAGVLNLNEAVSGYRAYLQDRLDRTQERAKGSDYQRARAAEIDERVAQREDNLIPIDELFMAIDKLLNVSKEAFAPLPERFTSDPADRKRLQEMLDLAHAEALARRHQAYRNLRAGRPVDDPLGSG